VVNVDLAISNTLFDRFELKEINENDYDQVVKRTLSLAEMIKDSRNDLTRADSIADKIIQCVSDPEFTSKLKEIVHSSSLIGGMNALSSALAAVKNAVQEVSSEKTRMCSKILEKELPSHRSKFSEDLYQVMTSYRSRSQQLSHSPSF